MSHLFGQMPHTNGMARHITLTTKQHHRQLVITSLICLVERMKNIAGTEQGLRQHSRTCRTLNDSQL
jgi:hypothetical protein